MQIRLGKRLVGDDLLPLLIAEMSGNHNQSLERALDIVDAAAAAGVEVLKLQTYTADTMTLNVRRDEFRILDKDSLWQGRYLHDLYQEAHTPWEWHQPIFDRCRRHGMMAISTPFDETAVDFLESLDTPFYKIASFEINHIPLIKKVASTEKPIIFSTGMAKLSDIECAVNAAKESGGDDIILLQCTSNYPASSAASNLVTIPLIRDLFGCLVGLSDHTLGMGVAIGAVALGACVIEKHITIRRSDGGVDSDFSMETDEIPTFLKELTSVSEAIGEPHFGPSDEENASLKYRRSIYICKDVQAGEVLDATNMKIVRPSYGLAPKNWTRVVGGRARRALKAGDPLDWNMVELSDSTGITIEVF